MSKLLPRKAKEVAQFKKEVKKKQNLEPHSTNWWEGAVGVEPPHKKERKKSKIYISSLD